MSRAMLWVQCLLYCLLALMAILFPLLPLGMDGSQVVLPDLFFALTGVWVVRRPESAPFLLVALLALLGDFLQSRPPGLWALVSLLGIEFLRGQREVMLERFYFNEWITQAIVFAVMLLLNGIIMTLALVPMAESGETWPLLFTTIAVLPMIALILHYVFFIRPPKPAERVRQFGRLT